MKSVFNPRTVALIGATDKEGSVGRSILENLSASPHGSRIIFPINPSRKEVLGLTCYPSIAAIGHSVDLAVIATPAQGVPGIVDECGMAGAAGAIIVSAGFRETGDSGKQLESAIASSAKKYGMRIVGPNCLGIIRPAIGLNASFLKANPMPGKIAFISQSGALGSAVLDWAAEANVGFSMFASLGSMIDVDFGDMIDFLGEDPQTRSIMLYMESVGNARKFMSAARGFARNKPIIVVKPGRFNESAGAALSHTGAMAGDDQAYEAAFKRVGVLRVHEVGDLFNASEVLHSRTLPRGPRIAAVTNAGGLGVMLTDKLIESGGSLAKLSDETIEKLNGLLPRYWSRGNPVDILGDAGIERYLDAINACLADGNVDGVIVIYTPQGAASATLLAEQISDIASSSFKPIITAFMGGNAVQEGRRILHKNNVPTYQTPEEAAKTYMYMYQYGRNLELLYETPAELPIDQAPPKHHLKAMIKRIAREGRRVLSEVESKDFLRNYGIPVNKASIARTAEDAVRLAMDTGYPVALKILATSITHKSDSGGVALNVHNEQVLRAEYLRMMSAAASSGTPVEGVTVQKMVSKIDYEILLGAKRDRDFASVILFGSGGTNTEVYRDFSVGLPPMSQTLALRLMEETKLYKMLSGHRGRKPADLMQLEQIIASFSNLIVDFPEISEIEINPLAISDGKACALDARIILDESTETATHAFPHLVMTPYPSKYITPWRLADSTEVLLRPIRPEDEPLEYEMLTTLSEEALRYRFFHVIRNISHEMLIRFCNIDYDREMAIVAEAREDQRRRIVGIGRLIMDAASMNGEFAVVVHDDYQGKGLGYKLVDMLVGIGQEKGLRKIYGDILSVNSKMLQVAEELGFRIIAQEDEISRVELVLNDPPNQ